MSSISSFTGAPSALARIAVVSRVPELSAPTAASARADLVCSDLAWSLGHGGTGPYGPTPSARPGVANTRARHYFLASASGLRFEVVARCLCSDKIKYKYGRGIYIYEIWFSLAIQIMALHPTPLEPPAGAAPVTRTRCALASEIGLLAGHAFVLARLIRCGSKTSSGNWRCRMSWSVECGMHDVGRTLLAYSRSKKIPTENLHSEPPFHQNLALDYPSSS
jgi:hypothetical protein